LPASLIRKSHHHDLRRAQIEEDNFLIVLERCYRDDKNVVCELAITNQGEDRRKLRLNTGNRLNTDGGQSAIFTNKNRYLASQSSLADQISQGSYSILEMPSNIAIGATLTFTGVPSSVNTIEAIEINIGTNTPLKLSDVSIVTKN
jgi:hypothetical protein